QPPRVPVAFSAAAAAITGTAHGPNISPATIANGALDWASCEVGTMPIISTEEVRYTTPAMAMPPSVARGTLRSGSSTTPATIAPVSRPTKAQKIGASDCSTTAVSEVPDTFQAVRYTSGSKYAQPAVRIAATGSRPSTTHIDWKRAIGRGPIRFRANISQISATCPARRTPVLSSIGNRITR